MILRRRAAGGPAEDTFRTLVGLELRAGRVREAAALWAELTRSEGVGARDGLWSQVDLMTTGGGLDDPTAFAQRRKAGDAEEYGDLEAKLAKILGNGDETTE